MYCRNCGTQIETGWKYCRTCGQPVEQPQSQPDPPKVKVSEKVEAPKQSSSKSYSHHQPDAVEPKQVSIRRRPKTKTIWLVASLVLIFIAGFVVFAMSYLKATNSPADIARELNKALDTQNVQAFVNHLDSKDSVLTTEERLDSLATALQNLETRISYKKEILNALEDVEGNSSAVDGGLWLKFVKVSSWQGSEWRIQVTPGTIELKHTSQSPDPNTEVNLIVGSMKSNSFTLRDVWPGTYNYKLSFMSKSTNKYYGGELEILSGYNQQILD